jgi:hypothetical protein
MLITIVAIEHNQQRYETVGDWQWRDKENTNLLITVSNMQDWRFNFLVAFHEQVEVMLCKLRNISQEDVDKFDIEYEKNRPENDVTESGNDPSAPYYNEHQFATKLERLMARELGVNWDEYDQTVNNL